MGLEDSQFIILSGLQEASNIQSEAEIASTVKACLFPVDKNSGLIVHRSKVELDVLALPVGRHLE